jgi:hypothetical protein
VTQARNGALTQSCKIILCAQVAGTDEVSLSVSPCPRGPLSARFDLEFLEAHIKERPQGSYLPQGRVS